MTDAPRFANDWEGLAAVAERLRDDRTRGDPDQVRAGRFTQRQADDRARVSQALALQWRAIARREPIPWLDAGPVEIRADLEAAAAATAKRAGAAPKAAVQIGAAQISYADFAEAVAALLWQQRPYRDGTDTPRIVFIHSINQMARARQAERSAAPAKRAAELPPAPPLKQASLI